MTAAEIDAAFDLLSSVKVDVAWSPELGVEYFQQTLLECRQWQDQVGDLHVKVLRWLATIKRLSTLSKAEASVLTGPERQVALVKAATHKDILAQLEHLAEAVGVVAVGLKGKSTDIRALMRASQEARFIGAEPGKEIGKMRTSLSGSTQPAPAELGEVRDPLDDLSGLVEQPAAAPTIEVTPFDGPMWSDGTPAPHAEDGALHEDLSAFFA